MNFNHKLSFNYIYRFKSFEGWKQYLIGKNFDITLARNFLICDLEKETYSFMLNDQIQNLNNQSYKLIDITIFQYHKNSIIPNINKN